jgi:hypothetical protein
MKAYSIHLRQHEQTRDCDIVLVVEGFCWSAFILNIIWTLWHRMWWVTLGLVGVSLIVNGTIFILGMDALAMFFLSIGSLALFGFLANDLRRWSLARVGFLETGVALGDNQDKALARFLDDAPEIARDIY